MSNEMARSIPDGEELVARDPVRDGERIKLSIASLPGTPPSRPAIGFKSLASSPVASGIPAIDNLLGGKRLRAILLFVIPAILVVGGGASCSGWIGTRWRVGVPRIDDVPNLPRQWRDDMGGPSTRLRHASRFG